jgi:hypothetical protein
MKKYCGRSTRLLVTVHSVWFTKAHRETIRRWSLLNGKTHTVWLLLSVDLSGRHHGNTHCYTRCDTRCVILRICRQSSPERVLSEAKYLDQLGGSHHVVNFCYTVVTLLYTVLR